MLNAVLVRPLAEMLMVLAATLSKPPGHRYLFFGFGTPNIKDIFMGLLIITISWVMAEGYKLQQDQQLTV